MTEETTPRSRIKALAEDLNALHVELTRADSERAWLYHLAGTLLKHTAPGLAFPAGSHRPHLEHPNGHVANALDGARGRIDWCTQLAAAAGVKREPRR